MEPPEAERSQLTHVMASVTLPQLQRLYTQSYGRILDEAMGVAADSDAAHQLVQDAFAQAARIRFSFHSEQALLSWVTGTISVGGAPVLSVRSRMARASDWEDVLRRASISTRRSGEPLRGSSPSDLGSRSALAAIFRQIRRRRRMLD